MTMAWDKNNVAGKLEPGASAHVRIINGAQVANTARETVGTGYWTLRYRARLIRHLNESLRG